MDIKQKAPFLAPQVVKAHSQLRTSIGTVLFRPNQPASQY